VTRYEQLLAEELTELEVRTLLERLGEDEFPEAVPTLGAVAEATGADPAVVGRLLAEIRKEEFEDRFGIRVQNLEHEVGSLASETSVLSRKASEVQLQLSHQQDEIMTLKQRLSSFFTGVPPVVDTPRRAWGQPSRPFRWASEAEEEKPEPTLRDRSVLAEVVLRPFGVFAVVAVLVLTVIWLVTLFGSAQR